MFSTEDNGIIDTSTFIENFSEEIRITDIDQFPRTIASCYIFNDAYRISLELLRDRLEEKLQANLIAQEELMSSTSTPNEFVHPNSFLKFLAPYFRDIKNFAPDDNQETKSRKDSGCINLFYLRFGKSWKDSDKLALTLAVQNYVTKKDMEPHTMRMNRLLEEINFLKSQGASEELIAEKYDILEVQRNEIEMIQAISTLPLRSNDIDWLEVAQSCPSIYTEFDCEIQWNNFQHPDINHGDWTPTEENKLKSLIDDENPDWDRVAKQLGTGRVAWQCCQRFQLHLNDKILRSGSFTQEEIDLLNKLIAKLSIGNFIPWHQVSYFMERRTLAQIKHFWFRSQSSRSRTRWSELEDEVLVAAVKKVGPRWIKVANYIPGRNNRQCRERYRMRLEIKDRKLGDWTFSEDYKLVTMAPNVRFRWVEMMAFLTKRNPRQIAARYDLISRNQIDKAIETSKDLRDLVPRNKSYLKHSAPELNLKEGQTIDEFLREARKELEINLKNRRTIVTRPGVGGRKRNPESAEMVEQELVQRFSLYSLMGITSKPTKRIARASQESAVCDVLENVLKSYFSGRLPDTPHLLAQVVSHVLRNQVIGLNPTRLNYCPPIFPPNIVTTRSYQVLLLMRKHLEQQLVDYSNDSNQFAWHHHYRSLLGVIVSLFFWPCLMSKQKPISLKPSLSSSSSSPSSTTITPKSSSKGTSKKRKKSVTQIDFCNIAREKQRRLFSDYEKYLEKSN